MAEPAPARYTMVAIVLHWMIGAAVLALIGIGLTMMHAPIAKADKFRLFQLHKSIGITVLWLVVARVAWRFAHPPPALPADMPALERRAAGAAHLGLYAFLIGLPLTGWALVSASPLNIPTILYGLVRWPHLPVLSTLQHKAPVEEVFKDIHTWGAWILIALVALHIAAALRHQFVMRDDVFWRMLPIVRRRGGSSRAEGGPRG